MVPWGPRSPRVLLGEAPGLVGTGDGESELASDGGGNGAGAFTQS